MDCITPDTLVYLISELSGQAVVVDEGGIPFTLPLSEDLDFPSTDHCLVICIDNDRGQALGLVFGSPSIFDEIG